MSAHSFFVRSIPRVECHNYSGLADDRYAAEACLDIVGLDGSDVVFHMNNPGDVVTLGELIAQRGRELAERITDPNFADAKEKILS